MAFYKDRLNFTPHNPNNSTITVNGETVIKGWDSLTIERDEDEVTVQKVADGTAIFNENPSRSGTITITVLEADPSCLALWTLHKNKTTFSFSHFDSANPEHRCSTPYCRIMKAPTQERGAETALVEFTLVATYLDVEGGSYTLVTS